MAQYSVTGGFRAVNNTNQRLEVYLVDGAAGAELAFEGADAAAHQWFSYTSNANDATPVPCIQTGSRSVVTNLADGAGYYVGDPAQTATRYVWIIDYSQHRARINGLQIEEDEQDRCDYLKLIADISADELRYVLLNGAVNAVQRTFHLTYNTLKWDEGTSTFLPEPVDRAIAGVQTEILLEAPLLTTAFTLAGDDFAQHFNHATQQTTAVYDAIALDVHSTATQRKEAGDSEQHTAGTTLGGSAPVQVTFEAFANEPIAAKYTWEIAEIDAVTGDKNLLVQFKDRVLDYTFEASGRYEAKLTVNDSQTKCVNAEERYLINIGESSLKLPNAFSPGSSFGSNDEYRVSYKSLVSFKASILNRQGNLLYQWTDPAKGWDGRVGGRIVATGVYYIVVEAKGADGKIYRESSDINVLYKR
jgi:hypothetical protein